MTGNYRFSVCLHCTVAALVVIITAVHASSNVATPSEIPNYNCSEKCAFQTIQLWNPTLKSFFKCMKDCVQNEWLLFQNITCLDEFRQQNFSADLLTCRPIDIKVHEFAFQLQPNGPLHGYLLIMWQPCPYGKDAVDGYNLDIQHFGRTIPDCNNIELTRYLDRTEQVTFVAFYPTRLNPGETYTIYLTSVPYNKQSESAKATYTTKTCAQLNTDGDECKCPDDPVKNYTYPNVTVQGYSVTISGDPVPPCKSIYYYHLFISIHLPGRKYGYWMVYENFFRNDRRRTMAGDDRFFLAPGERPNTTFGMIYPIVPGGNITAGLLLVTSYTDSIMRALTIKVKPWIPPVPRVTLLDTGAVEVSFAPSSREYNITVYAVRLNTHPNDNAEFRVDQERNVTLRQMDKNGNITTLFYNVEPALHSVQIREVRVNFHDRIEEELRDRLRQQFFQTPAWSDPVHFRLLSDWDKFKAHGLVPVLSCVAVIVLLVITVVLFLYFWKEGYCPRVRYYVPMGLAKWLDSQTTSEVALKSHTVLLVWQADTRSSELAEKHANVIRHLASFLRSVCGLDVILDMFEQTQMSTAMSKWVHEAYEKAEFVIFVCPHFECDLEPEDGNFTPILGDFNYIFKYMEPRIRDRRKFVTALLPYSDVNSCEASKALKNCTLLFRLMDQIDDLYLHIQGKSKVTFMGRHSVVYVNRKDYKHTSQGSALSEGINDMEALISEHRKFPFAQKRISRSSASSSSMEASGSSRSLSEDNGLRSSRCSDFASDMATNRLGVHPPEAVKCLCRKVTDRIHPPPPLVENPEEQIRLINCAPPAAAGHSAPGMLAPTPEEACPYHNPRITVQDSSCSTYPDDGYGEPTNTDLSTQDSSPAEDHCADETIMRFLRARSLVPQTEIAQLSVQTLPTIDSSSSQNSSEVFHRPVVTSHSLESVNSVAREDIIERYTSV